MAKLVKNAHFQTVSRHNNTYRVIRFLKKPVRDTYLDSKPDQGSFSRASEWCKVCVFIFIRTGVTTDAVISIYMLETDRS